MARRSPHHTLGAFTNTRGTASAPQKTADYFVRDWDEHSAIGQKMSRVEDRQKMGQKRTPPGSAASRKDY